MHRGVQGALRVGRVGPGLGRPAGREQEQRPRRDPRDEVGVGRARSGAAQEPADAVTAISAAEVAGSGRLARRSVGEPPCTPSRTTDRQPSSRAAASSAISPPSEIPTTPILRGSTSARCARKSRAASASGWKRAGRRWSVRRSRRGRAGRRGGRRTRGARAGVRARPRRGGCCRCRATARRRRRSATVRTSPQLSPFAVVSVPAAWEAQVDGVHGAAAGEVAEVELPKATGCTTKNANAAAVPAATAQPTGREAIRCRMRSTTTKVAATATAAAMTTSVRSAQASAPAAPPYSSMSSPLPAPAAAKTAVEMRATSADRDMLRLSHRARAPPMERTRLSRGRAARPRDGQPRPAGLTDVGARAHESQIGPKAGIPRRSEACTRRSVAALLLTTKTASASKSRWASQASCTRSGLPRCVVSQITASGCAASTSSTRASP